MPKLGGMVYLPQNRAQIYDFFSINKEVPLFYRLLASFYNEISKQFFTFVRCNHDFSMLRKGNIHKWLMATCLSFVALNMAFAQEVDHLFKVKALIEKGDSLRAAYRFSESLIVYDSALQQTEEDFYVGSDSLLRIELHDKILMSENGRSMTGFVDVPRVVARQKFSIDDFFLYYPLQDTSWRTLVNQLDSSVNHKIVKSTYIKAQDRVMFWSAEDNEGIRNIYTSSLRDSLWSLPSLLNEHLTSAADEIFPMLSPDGKSLFFSSAGLYGVGGYDIYVSRWNDDTNDWGAPVNMGFPYSSPADDFLYIDTDDGRYSVFASNRDCTKDSVWVYVLEYNTVPVRRAVENPQQLLEIANLEPIALHSSTNTPASAGEVTADVERYILNVREVRSLKDSVSYYSAFAAEGKGIEKLAHFKTLLSSSHERLGEMEMNLMLRGVSLDPDELQKRPSDQVVLQTETFSFVKKTLGAPLNIPFEVPVVKFDYSFKVMDEAQFAEDQTIPSGLVYQIQMFASKKKAKIKELKGLSPVYETVGANSHIVYRVGLFRTYADVLSHLNTVKKVGFRNAYIVAFIDGKSVTVAKARAKEKEIPVVQEFYEVRMIPPGGDLDSSIASGIRQQSNGKDIARTVKADGSVVYVVGPFSDKTQADELVLFIKAMGLKDVMCNVIQK